MSKMPQKFVDRFKAQYRRYQKILESARKRDVNESDTSVIVSDFLSDVLGYDKYAEVTTEFSVRSTFCDLAIKCDNRLCYLIEVKPINTDLKENHIRQAVDYGAKEGCDWVLLTNGATWQAYRIKYEQPIDYDLVFTVDLLDSEVKPVHIAQQLYLIAKETSGGKDIDRYYRQREVTSRFVVAQVLLHDNLLGALRRELRRLSPEARISTDELAQLLETEIMKRDVLEGDKVAGAVTLVKKLARRRQRRKAAEEEKDASPAAPASPSRASPPPAA